MTPGSFVVAERGRVGACPILAASGRVCPSCRNQTLIARTLAENHHMLAMFAQFGIADHEIDRRGVITVTIRWMLETATQLLAVTSGEIQAAMSTSRPTAQTPRDRQDVANLGASAAAQQYFVSRIP